LNFIRNSIKIFGAGRGIKDKSSSDSEAGGISKSSDSPLSSFTSIHLYWGKLRIFPEYRDESQKKETTIKRPKVALVEASSPFTNIYSKTYLPRVGIPTIGAVLKRSGFDCDLWFQAISPVDEKRLREYEIVGISSLSCTIPEAYRLADSLKESGETLVVMGGPHVTFMPEEALEHCDYVAIGEGDASFPALVEALSKGDSPEAVPGLAYRLPDRTIHYSGPSDIVDYANLPSPDFSLSPQLNHGEIPPIVVTSRGCPHDCTFCSVTSVFGRHYRLKTKEQVIAELRPVCHRSVCFGDDNFCANPKRTKDLLREMIAQDAVPFTWAGEMCVRAASDNELLDLMQETRCRIMYVGIESLDPKTLKKFGKAHNFEDIGRCIERLHNHNIGIHGMFVVGVENRVDSVREIVDYAITNDIDTIQIMSLTPFPGTKSYDEFKDRLLHRDWRYYDGMHVVAEPLECTAYEMQLAIMQEMRRFYNLKRLAGAYIRGRSWRLKYRTGGYYITRKWIKENEEYLERLRTGYYHH